MKFAAIDIGSNAIRLLVSRLMNGDQPAHFKKIEFVRIPLRLGDDVFKNTDNKKISKEKRAQLYKSMQAFKLLMEVYGVDDYMACATSAMREASNGPKVVDRIYEEFGLKIEVISGKRESEIILNSVMNYFPENGNYLNIDVGGGSTEMTVIDDHKPIKSISFDVGTVRLLDGAVDEKVWEEMEQWVYENTSQYKSLTGIGTSGTMNKLYNIGEKKDQRFLSYTELEKLHKLIRSYSIKERISKLKLNPDRADIIEPSAYVYLNIMKWAKIDKIYAPEGGLKEGILSELRARHRR